MAVFGFLVLEAGGHEGLEGAADGGLCFALLLQLLMALTGSSGSANDLVGVRLGVHLLVVAMETLDVVGAVLVVESRGFSAVVASTTLCGGIGGGVAAGVLVCGSFLAGGAISLLLLLLGVIVMGSTDASEIIALCVGSASFSVARCGLRMLSMVGRGQRVALIAGRATGGRDDGADWEHTLCGGHRVGGTSSTSAATTTTATF